MNCIRINSSQDILARNKDLNIFIQGDVIIAMCARNCNCPKVELTIFLNEFIHCFQNFVKNLRTGHEENCIISYQLYSYIMNSALKVYIVFR